MDYVNMIAHDYLAKNDFIKRKEYSICIVKDHSCMATMYQRIHSVYTYGTDTDIQNCIRYCYISLKLLKIQKISV